MIDKDKQLTTVSKENSVKPVFQPRMARNNVRKSLFTRLKNEQERRTQISNSYFSDNQIQLLAEFFELPEINALSVDDLLSCRSADNHKLELQKILKKFIIGQADSVCTAKRLEKFIDEAKPLAWQVWRLFDHWRYQKLRNFIEGFKCNCLKEVLQDMRGYKGAPNVFDASKGIISEQSEAANFASTRVRIVPHAKKNAEEKQKDSLFLKFEVETQTPEATFSKPNKSQKKAQSKSFFRVDN